MLRCVTTGAFVGLLMGLLTACSPTQQPSPIQALEPAPLARPVEKLTPAPIALEDPATVWGQLQRADEQVYGVLLRHAIAPGTGDPANFRLGDCATQRNLSAEGQAQAQRIGAAFRQRQVPVVQVLSSEWCRSLETAELMQVGPVEPFAPLNSFFRDRSTAAQQTAQVKAHLRSQPQRGVIVMVTHQVNITALTGVVPGSGQAVVVTLNEAGDLAQVGLLDAGQ